MINIKEIRKVKDAIIFLENEIMGDLFEYLKTGKFQIKKNILSSSYSIIQIIGYTDDDQSRELFHYYKEIIRNYIIDCSNKLSSKNNTNLIDEFLFHTKNIYFFMYWMIKVFHFLDCFYTKAKLKDSLSSIAFNLYKSNFYEEFKDNIQDEINNLKNEEKEGNKEASSKIQSIMKIIEDTKLLFPKSIKVENEIKWIEN